MDEYGVFKGIPQMQPFQLGLVSDLERAVDLMNRMYERIPGNYFVRHMVSKEVLASLSYTEAATGGEASTKEPPFDIYCGAPDKNAVWYESVDGLASARIRMEQIARNRPGKYFLFSRRTHAILAQVETFADARSPVASGSAA